MDADADIQTVIKKEDFDTNPWSVDDASVFLKYNCPECDYNDGSLKVFSHHALENHVRSSILFKDMKNGDHETIPTNKVEDHGSYFDTSPPSPDHYGDQGNLFKGIDKKTVRREGFSNLFTYILFLAHTFSKATRWLQKSCTLFYIHTIFPKIIF